MEAQRSERELPVESFYVQRVAAAAVLSSAEEVSPKTLCNRGVVMVGDWYRIP